MCTPKPEYISNPFILSFITSEIRGKKIKNKDLFYTLCTPKNKQIGIHFNWLILLYSFFLLSLSSISFIINRRSDIGELPMYNYTLND